MGNDQATEVDGYNPSIFKHQIRESRKGCSSVAKCEQTKRVILALQHYESLDMNNEKHHDILIDFVTTKYKYFMDDRNHMVLHHGNEIEDIHTIVKSNLLKCNFKTCLLSNRSNRNREKSETSSKAKQIKPSVFIFWRDIFDELHSFIIHSFDYGLRIKRDELTMTDEKSNNESDESLVDNAFTSLHRLVLSKREKLTEMNRVNSNKFTIDTSFDAENKAEGKEEETNTAYNSFSIGYTFYYWKYYKNRKTEELDQFEWNRNDHLGHCVSTLYVEPKYKSIKSELLTNKIHKINVQQYLLLLNKAQIIMNCKVTKMIKAGDEETVELDKLHYDITPESPISVHHILSLLCYTDFTDLSSAFSATFRAIYKNESLSSIKKRNSEFGNLSKHIREAVQCYGNELGNKAGDTPFYCGISYMVVPSFVIRICSPTSTTKQLVVAARFSGDNGIIIQVGHTSIWFSEMLRTFNCSWLSAFPAEDERLFCGGNYPLRLESVRLVQTHKNFAKYFKALFYLDVGLSGMGLTDSAKRSISGMEVKIINEFIKDLLKIDGYSIDKVDEYVKDTFKVFCHHKKEIVINIELMNDSLVLLKETLFESVSSNVLNFDLFNKLFVHCQHIIFTEEWDEERFSIDLQSFLSGLVPVLSDTNCHFKTVTIKCRRINGTETWLYQDYTLRASDVNSLCDLKGISVSLTLDDADEEQVWDILAFTKD